jgi:hypothetical protein
MESLRFSPNIAESGYTWDDAHFAEYEGVVAVFDYDYDKIIDFDWKIQKCTWAICPHMFMISIICCIPCFAYQNIEWRSRAQHVAVHRDGIKFVKDKRQADCGCACQDQGKESKTVPFDKLTDCDVQEPAGTAICCFVPNVLSTVTVDTASSGSGPGQMHELSLRGLKDSHGLKKCVWDCKRGGVNFGGAEGISGVASGVLAQTMDHRLDGTVEMVPLLREIRDELRAQTRLLEKRADTA